MSGKIIVGDGRSVGVTIRNGISDIPSGSKKMVQSLKEIVNCPEAEIYAVLKDCNMDPNEAVSRLLSQDPFHEVKSKKEKKKEIRDIPDSRRRGYSNNYNHGIRGGSDRYAGRNGATTFSSNDSGSFQGKTTNKRESGMQTHAGSYSSTSGISSHHQIPHSASTISCTAGLQKDAISLQRCEFSCPHLHMWQRNDVLSENKQHRILLCSRISLWPIVEALSNECD